MIIRIWRKGSRVRKSTPANSSRCTGTRYVYRTALPRPRREPARHPAPVGSPPRHNDGRIVLVRQFRYVTGRELWEIPAGTLDKPGEDIPAAARRELAEGAGFEAA